MFVGGEFCYDGQPTLSQPGPDWQRQEAAASLFLSGGSACLRLIAACLRREGIRRILLPEYLCPAILDAFQRGGLEYSFYQVNEDLSIDLVDAARKAEGERALLYINYFGFPRSPAEQEFFRQLRAAGLRLVADNCQAGLFDWPLAEADFAFNSLRKFAPYDGGWLAARASPDELAAALADLALASPGERLGLIREYRSALGEYLLRGRGSHRRLASLLRRAETAYEREDTLLGDEQERQGLARLDWAAIRQSRRANYAYLASLLPSIPGVRSVLPPLGAVPENAMPLGLPIYLEEVPAAPVLAALARAQVALLSHWEQIPRDPRTRRSPRAVSMARQMITLAVDQRAARRELDYQALQLVRALEDSKALQG